MNHPAILDQTSHAVPFLDWVATQGYRVAITFEYGQFKATLVGTRHAWSGHGESGVSDITGYGRTKEEAVDKLKSRCSGAEHHPQARDGFFTTHFGPELKFPMFQ